MVQREAFALVDEAVRGGGTEVLSTATKEQNFTQQNFYSIIQYIHPAN